MQVGVPNFPAGTPLWVGTQWSVSEDQMQSFVVEASDLIILGHLGEV